jgi:hypothetical protein
MIKLKRVLGASALALGVCLPAACTVAEPGVTCPQGVVYEAESQAINVIFLLDRSGSMHLPVADGTSRWQATKVALFDMFDALEERAYGAVSMFPAGDEPLTCCTVDNPNCGLCDEQDIPGPSLRCDPDSYTGATLDLMTRDRIEDMKAEVSSSDDENYWGTPMAAALAGVLHDADQQKGDWENVVVLLTDGEPAACDSESNPFGNDIDLAIGEVQKGHKLGIKTYVVGVVHGDQAADEGHLSSLAVAGGTARYEGCEASDDCAYEVHADNFAEDVQSALAAIVQDTTSCAFAINGLDPEDGPTVSIDTGSDRVNLSQDTTHANGWDLLPSGEIQLYGEACELFKGEGSARLQVNVGCG